ncbi:unnamed protein product [Chondrus crispus]|uniref:Structural maintenance of chromosomes protein n=1 Tax=Chondrus crispus TaxID=2769 RepID=R7QJ47_CHOCR|nr:unnamed protein product [Chondrus crispus]CDF38522.1 unnamed protein product [Chondrus crispus]|eukprot:XP_005718415.1 unnamed protein product [Chondrus crispus]
MPDENSASQAAETAEEEIESDKEAAPTPVAPEVVPSTAPPSRLAIQRLRLENFKSYGGCIDVGPFHKSFSAIVGPNGSGKSNVIDAMLFVFGRRAKQLRHSKLSELLHNSSAYPKVQSATVTVYFHEIIDTGDGELDYEVVSGSEIAVGRTAFRNNTSKYYLNGKEVKMGRVVELLKSKGVDLDNNRFLILQGEVEQIAMMKPKAVSAHDDGLLEYLEDIIGSNRHIEAIGESARQMESLNEERGHKMNRVKAAEKERDALEKAKVEAEDYLDKERQLLTKKLKLNSARHQDVAMSFKSNSEKLAEATEKYEAFRNDVKEKEVGLKELEKTFKETQKSADVAIKTMNEAKDNYSAYERKDIKLREDIKALKAKEKKLKAAKETEPIRQRLEEKQLELLPFSEEVNKCRKDLEVNQSELKFLTEKLQAPSKNLSEATASLGRIEEEYHTARETLTCLETERGQIEQTIPGQKHAVIEKEAIVGDLSSSWSTMRKRVEEARSANDDLKTRSRLHAGILSASRNGELQGVVGRLGDLATVEPKYAAAVGAAAGSNLDCIVVQSAENAQACIQFLRRKNLGRATFVILDKIMYLRAQMQGWGSSPRRADGPRLFDFLQIADTEHCTAMYYSLRDTLVADSLESARRMAFKPTRQNRVVSLQGELIESSGAMTGGGRGPSRYRLGSGNANSSHLDQRELQNLVQRMDSAKEQIEAQTKTCQDTKRKGQLEKSVESSEKLLEKALAACEGLEAEITSLQEQIVASGGSSLQNAKEAVEKCHSEIADLTSVASRTSSRAAAAKKASEKAREATAAAEEAITSTQESIAEARRQSEEMLDDAEVVLRKYQDTEVVHKEWEEKVAKIQAEYSEVKNGLKQVRRKEVSLSEALQDVKRVAAHDKQELRILQKKEQNMKARLRKLSLVSVDMQVAADSADAEEKDVEETQKKSNEKENLVEEREELKMSAQDQKQLSMEITVLESELSKLSPNIGAIAEYQSKDAEYKSQVNELDALTANRDNARKQCDSLRKMRLDEFMAGFSVITLKLKELYQMITLGGDAELELVDSLDPFSEGIVFSVRPPKKSWKNISNLSGGEKTLSSLALVFALHHFKPTPLYFLDEIDAALDYKNVSIVANYVKDRTKNAQFIIISLRNNMFELADRLVGIYKTHNTTKSVTVDPAAFRDAIRGFSLSEPRQIKFLRAAQNHLPLIHNDSLLTLSRWMS